MLGGKNRQPLGYTILEVMIVLAISGVMFLIAATFVSGKQERTSFTAGVNEMASQLQDIIEQVTDGQYSDIPLGCTFNGTSTGFGETTTAQGTNSTCVFLGKVLQFTSRPSDPGIYNILSLAGGRVDSSDNLITSLSAADPAVITDLTLFNQAVPQGLEVGKLTVNGSQSYAIGFIQSQGQTSGGSTPFASGAQTVGVYYDSTDSTYSSSFSPGSLTAATSVDICLTDGTRYADITLGTDSNGTASNPLNVSVQNDGTTEPNTCKS